MPSVKYLADWSFVMASLNELRRQERDLQEEIYKLGPERTPEKSELLRKLREVQGEIRRLEDQSK